MTQAHRNPAQDYHLRIQFRQLRYPVHKPSYGIFTSGSPSALSTNSMDTYSTVSPRYNCSELTHQFLLFLNPALKIHSLHNTVLRRFEKLYPSERVPSVISIRDKSNCDLDPDYTIGEIFAPDDVVQVVYACDTDPFLRDIADRPNSVPFSPMNRQRQFPPNHQNHQNQNQQKQSQPISAPLPEPVVAVPLPATPQTENAAPSPKPKRQRSKRPKTQENVPTPTPQVDAPVSSDPVSVSELIFPNPETLPLPTPSTPKKKSPPKKATRLISEPAGLSDLRVSFQDQPDALPSSQISVSLEPTPTMLTQEPVPLTQNVLMKEPVQTVQDTPLTQSTPVAATKRPRSKALSKEKLNSMPSAMQLAADASKVLSVAQGPILASIAALDSPAGNENVTENVVTKVPATKGKAQKKAPEGEYSGKLFSA